MPFLAGARAPSRHSLPMLPCEGCDVIMRSLLIPWSQGRSVCLLLLLATALARQTAAAPPATACTPLTKQTVVLYAGLKAPSGDMGQVVQSLPDDKKIDVSDAHTQYIPLGDGVSAPGPCVPGLSSHAGNLIVWEDGSLPGRVSVLSQLNDFTGVLVLFGKTGRDVDGLTDLTALSNLRAVRSLYIYHMDGLKDLTGLSSLAEVTGDLVVSNNDNLATLRGLGGLTKIGTDFVLNSNLRLVSVDGLQALQSVGDDVVIKGNGNLATLDRLMALRSVGGRAYITNNGDTHLTLPGALAGRSPGGTGSATQADGGGFTASRLAGGAADEDLHERAGDSAPVMVLYGSATPPALADVQVHVGDYMPPLSTFTMDDATVQFVSANSGVRGSAGVVRGHVILWDDGSLPPLASALPGVTTITGQLLIIANKTMHSGMGLTTLDGLQALQNVGGLGLVRLQSLRDLTGLSSLSGIHGNLVAVDNPQLTSFVGIGPVLKTRSDLWIDNNVHLASFDGLQSLREVGYRMHIKGNKALTSLDGLSGVQLVRQEIMIKTNGMLQTLGGLRSLQEVGANIAIMWNSGLLNLDGLGNLTQSHIDGDLIISGNAALTSLRALNRVSSVRLNLLVSGNHALQDLAGLESMERVGFTLAINNNDNLLNLRGLGGLKVVGHELYIRDNAVLTSLQDLPGALRQVGSGPGRLGHLFIQDNPRLHSLDGLQDALAGMLDGLAGVHIRGAIPQSDVVKLVAKDQNSPQE